jgi:AraC-like DNA-binding protein
VLNVKETATCLGYADSSRFVEDFRKMYGLTPVRHRRLAPIPSRKVAGAGQPRTTCYGQRTNAARLADE